MDRLVDRHCQEKTSRVEADRVPDLLAQLDGWAVEGDRLRKTFSFKNYYHTMAFVNLVAWVANRENHHPDMLVRYNKCSVDYTTHSVGGLSENDFISAAHLDAAMPR